MPTGSSAVAPDAQVRTARHVRVPGQLVRWEKGGQGQVSA